MAERILSISGLRGIVGDGLDPEYVTHFAAALGTMCQGGTVVLARENMKLLRRIIPIMVISFQLAAANVRTSPLLPLNSLTYPSGWIGTQ